jgi:hypothetical protein
MTTEVSRQMATGRGQMAGAKRLALLAAMAEAVGVSLPLVLAFLNIHQDVNGPVGMSVDLCDALIEVLARLPIAYQPSET